MHKERNPKTHKTITAISTGTYTPHSSRITIYILVAVMCTYKCTFNIYQQKLLEAETPESTVNIEISSHSIPLSPSLPAKTHQAKTTTK